MLWLRHKYVKARNCYQCQSIVKSDPQIIRLCSVYGPASGFMLHLATLQPSVVQSSLYLPMGVRMSGSTWFWVCWFCDGSERTIFAEIAWHCIAELEALRQDSLSTSLLSWVYDSTVALL